jgi:hypothetical protein
MIEWSIVIIVISAPGGAGHNRKEICGFFRLLSSKRSLESFCIALCESLELYSELRLMRKAEEKLVETLVTEKRVGVP